MLRLFRRQEDMTHMLHSEEEQFMPGVVIAQKSPEDIVCWLAE